MVGLGFESASVHYDSWCPLPWSHNVTPIKLCVWINIIIIIPDIYSSCPLQVAPLTQWYHGGQPGRKGKPCGRYPRLPLLSSQPTTWLPVPCMTTQRKCSGKDEVEVIFMTISSKRLIPSYEHSSLPSVQWFSLGEIIAVYTQGCPRNVCR